MIPMRPKDLFVALAEADVDFVLIGGLAGTLHGTTRVTRDIDIAYATNGANLQLLCDALNRFQPRRIVLGKAEGDVLTLTPDILKRGGILQLATTVGEVDLLNDVAGFSSYAYIKRLATVKDVGVPVMTLSPEGLIKTKRALKRPKDLQDIIELEAIEEVNQLSTPVMLSGTSEASAVQEPPQSDRS